MSKVDSWIFERSFIGACIVAGNKHLEIDLSANDFQHSRIGEIWSFISEVKDVDVTDLASKFGEKFISDMLEMNYYIGSLVRESAKIKAVAHRRRVIMVLSKAASELEYTDADINDVITMVMNSVDTGQVSSGAQKLPSVLLDVYKDLEDAHVNGVNINFTKTGMTAFDNSLGGLQNDGLIVVAGRPSMGKTAFATKVARNIGAEKPVLLISMEMTAKQLGMRYMAAEQGVDLQVMMQGKLPHDIWTKLAASVETLASSKIEINDMSSRSINDVCAESRRFKRAHPDMGCVIVDYLGLMELPNATNKTDAVGIISRQLKVLAGDIKCPVILLSQLNRKLEDRKDKAPQMADLRDSGAIEQDADQIIFPYRPEVYDHRDEVKGLAEIRMAKNRNGKIGKVKMAWIAKSATFDELESGDDWNDG